MSKEINERIAEALKNTHELIIAGKSYLESMIMQRIEGPTNAGSSYENVTPADLLQKLYDSEWEQVEVEGVMPGCTAFKTNLPGLNGIIDIENLSEDAEFYAIDPKGTGTIGIGVANVPKTPEQDTYLIVGEEAGKEVVFTFHPGKPVAPSMVETKDYPHGTKLTREQVKELGFSKAKYISEEMKLEFDNAAKKKDKEDVEF